MLRSAIGLKATRTLGANSLKIGSSTSLLRSFHYTNAIMKATAFNMPAMSPTMTEGGITSWKVKAGDSFSAGDVLLEVETDKATIDVEAQDDGQVWEILIGDGTSGIPVGKPIAYLAEPGDDLSSLEKPEIKEETKPEPKEEPKKEQPKEEPKKPQPKKESVSSDGVLTSANPNLRFFPSVEGLLHRHNITAEDAYKNIKASGPQGRILKGDVLAYLGEINQDSVVSITKYVEHKSHLDLSNIVLAVPEVKAKAPEPAQAVKPSNVISIRLSSPFENKDQFKYKFESTVHTAIVQTYASRFPQYAFGPSPAGVSDVFDELLVPNVNVERFKVFDINYKFHEPASVKYAYADAFDDLLSVSPSSSTVETGETGTVDVDFKIKSNELIDSKSFVETFQDSLLSQIPSKQLIIHS